MPHGPWRLTPDNDPDPAGDPYDTDPAYAAEFDRVIDTMAQAFDAYWEAHGTIDLQVTQRALRCFCDMLCDHLEEQMDEMDREVAAEEADA